MYLYECCKYAGIPYQSVHHDSHPLIYVSGNQMYLRFFVVCPFVILDMPCMLLYMSLSLCVCVCICMNDGMNVLLAIVMLYAV
jgi:hypothetical protein